MVSLYPAAPLPSCESRHGAVAERVASGHHERMRAEPLFTGIDHVGIAVVDLDAAIAFYRDVLGLVSIHEEVNEEQGVREVMLAVGDGDTRVQLLGPLSPDSAIAVFLDRRGPGMQQLAYTVEDIAAVSQTLRDRGLRLLYDLPRRGTAGSRVNFVHPRDAGGVLIELVEPAGRHVGSHSPRRTAR
jgi:methylmalonyl-CoA/ethylmalonyl-CoA epimerase